MNIIGDLFSITRPDPLAMRGRSYMNIIEDHFSIQTSLVACPYHPKTCVWDPPAMRGRSYINVIGDHFSIQTSLIDGVSVSS